VCEKQRNQQESEFHFYKVIHSVGHTWGISRLQADYTYPQYGMFTMGLESMDSHLKCRADSVCLSL